jgi:hypothetical protein
VLDKVRVTWTGRFEKLLEMIFGWSSLLLEVAFGNRYDLLAGVAGFLIVTAAVGRYGGAMGSPRLPLLATLSALSGTFGGGFSGCYPATIGHHPLRCLGQRWPQPPLRQKRVG